MKGVWNRVIAAYIAGLIMVASLHADEQADHGGPWIELFNGKDLKGWTPKFVGYDLGVNYKNTFVVKDGLLTVCYDNYKQWQDNIGHLFYQGEFSHYILRAEYRFIGNQVKGSPDWAYRNNGLMLHGQSAATMDRDQKFPDSIEAQLLGGHPDGKKMRSTLSLYTPGTHVHLDDKPDKHHEIQSNGPTFHGDQWVLVEIEVRGGEVIRHKVGGNVVMAYQKPHLDDGTLLEKGTISIQAEGHPTQFRKIELRVLKN